VEGGITENEMELRNLDYRISETQKQLTSLDDIRVSRLRFLQREYRDVHATVELLQDPLVQEQFKGTVHEPIILHTCVNDLKYGGHVERALGMDTMTAFLVEEADDLEMVLKVTKAKGLRVSVYHFPGRKNFQRPINTVNDQLK